MKINPHFKKYIEEIVGPFKIDKIIKPTMIKIKTNNGNFYKIDLIYDKNHKLLKTINNHDAILCSFIRVPDFYFKQFNNPFSAIKISEWIDGITLQEYINNNSDNYYIIIKEFIRYLEHFYMLFNMIPVDNHFKNFIVVENKNFINCFAIHLIDFKKLFQYSYKDCLNEFHQRLAKIIFKHTKGNKQLYNAIKQVYKEFKYWGHVKGIGLSEDWLNLCKNGIIHDYREWL